MSITLLLKSQKEIGDRIKSQRDKFLVTQIESRTLNYLSERLETVKCFWKEFYENNQKLLNSTELDGGHEYFDKSYFRNIEIIYNDYSGSIQEAIAIYSNSLELPAGVHTEPLMEFNLDGLLNQARASLPNPNGTNNPNDVEASNDNGNKNGDENISFPENLGTKPKHPSLGAAGGIGQPIDIQNMFRNYGSQMNLNNTGASDPANKYHNYQDELRFFAGILNSYYQRIPITDDDGKFHLQQNLVRKWEIIDKMHQRFMVEHADYDASPYRKLEADFDNILLDYKQRLRNQQTRYSGSSNPERRHEMVAKLPKLHVPKFSDDCIKYQSFKELFMTMVGSRPGLTEVEKFAYLKGQLEGESLRIITNLPIQNSSYNTAWNTLDSRFSNQHKITTSLFEHIVDIKPMKNPTSGELKEMVDVISQTVTALSNIGMPIDVLSNSFLYFHTERKIHPVIVRLYENTLNVPGTPRRYEDFMKFLQCRVQNSSSTKQHDGNKAKPKPSSNNGSSKGSIKSHENSGTVLTASTTQVKPEQGNCCCKENHLLFQCPKFLELKPDARLKKCQKLRHCVNCLRKGHKSKTCTSRPCTKCNRKHNTLLHLEIQPQQKESTVLIGSAISNKNFKHVFLATALVEVMDKYGNAIVIRALLDSGSQLNMITEKLHRKLGLAHNSTTMKINGVGTLSVDSHKRSVIQLKSKNSGFEAPLEVFVVKNVTTCQPLHEVCTKNWKIPKNVTLADPKFNIPAAVDLIIGGEIFFKLLSIGMISIGKNLPDLQNTVFGWVVIGKLLGLEQHEAFVGISTEQSLDKQLAEFWKIEEKFQPASKLTQLEQACEKHFEDTTIRNAHNGRFIVKLQFIKDPSILGKSELMATRRFHFLEKKFIKDPSMKEEYVTFMREYENLGHMMHVKRHELEENFYVIPHHAVRNPGSSTTKFRVVFDASAKTSSNFSLNEILANGPMLQDDLFSIMVRFRKHRYVFSADITKMYRKVEVDPNHMKWQVIVWREESHLPLKFYKLKTLTYGTTCASYLAIKSLQYLADEWKTTFPYGATVAKRDFNVDDVMTGSDDLLQTLQIQNQLIELCGKADFQLHKWCSNHPALLETIPKAKQEVSLDFNAEKTETKALGVKWIPKSDKFMLHYKPAEYKRITKRTVLSETAQLFDPLGLVNPVIVLAKIFLQELWALKLDWDAALPMELHSKWVEFRKELLKLNNISLPRHMVIQNPIDIQLHAFSDASTRAYGTACYLRSVSSVGKIQVNLICSKSRVAPVNATTLPRLELCAGVVMTELAEKLNKVLDMKINSITYWTDSELVLSWIYSDGTYKTFVANRIASIKRKTSVEDWKYINTKLNPADLISRGVLPDRLIHSDLWWHGPEFLQKENEHWPKIKPAFIREFDEERTIRTVLTAYQVEEHFIDRINHRNSIRVLQRVIAYMLRFRIQQNNGIKSKAIEKIALNILLTPDELQKALTIIIKYCQQQSFSEEIKLVKNGAGEKTKFSNFVPIIDADGVLRVGGRLQASNIPFEQKHPALLPKDHFVTRLIMEKVHMENMHAGPQALLAIVRQKYWPENGKRLSQLIVKNCILCVRSRPKLMEQLMGILPTERVNQTRPYIHVGLDFGGPITIHYNLRGKRATKAYICLFVCFTTKAVHIEAAADLTTEAFISCLKRFIARRGLPKKIFCDNATNFTSASNQLAELKNLMNDQEHQKKVIRYCQDHQIEWKFIPPRSPHFGGLHESAIKSCKLHMRKVLHSVHVTYDELITILAEIEAILNSRPLTPMSSDPNDLQPLTAGHFLIGAPMNCIDDSKLPPSSKTKMWNKIRMMKNEFWIRWSKEFLAELQHRNKWLKDCENIKVGSMVILKEINLPPLQWRMGRITKTISDNFGKIRVVMVKTDNGELKRAIHEVALLPVNSDEIDEDLGPNSNIDQPVVVAAQSKPIARKKKVTTQSNVTLDPTAKEFEPRITRSRAKKRASYSTIMLMVLSCFLVLIFGVISDKCDVQSFKSNPGLYFEEQEQISLTNDDWSIVCYVQLSDYWNQSITIKTLLDRLDEICPQLTQNDYCEVTRKQLRTQLNSILSKNELIRGFSHTRKRRAWSVEKIIFFNTLDTIEANSYDTIINKINQVSFQVSENSLVRHKRAWANFIGTGLNTVAGVLDDDDGKRIDGKIENLNQETRHILRLIGNQTTIQEITQNIIRRDEAGMSRQLKRLENEIDAVRNQSSSEKAETFNALAIQAASLINYHISTQNDLIDMIMNIHHGRISTVVITPSQLKQHMKMISGNISKELMIPGDDQKENIALVYATLKAQIRVTTTRIIVKLIMPLLHREFYKLYHIIPVPFSHRNSILNIIDLKYQYIGINAKQDYYYLLSNQQRSQCIQYSDELLICGLNHPIHNVQSGEISCEMAILTHQSKGIPPRCDIKQIHGKQLWSKLNSPNHFLFTMASPTTINFICKEISSTCTISGSGLINLPQQCIIQSGNIEITAQNVRNSELSVLMVPGLNISDVLHENIKTPDAAHQDQHVSYEPDPELGLLDSALQTQKFNINYIPTSIDWHDIHHYTSTYIIMALVIAFIGWYIYSTKRNICCHSTSSQSTGPGNIELVLPNSTHPKPSVRNNVRFSVPSGNEETVETISFS